MTEFDEQKKRSVEISPIEIGWRHLVCRFFHVPAPDAVKTALRIGVLLGNGAINHFKRPLVLAVFKQIQSILKRIAGGVNLAITDRRVIAVIGAQFASDHAFGCVVVCVHGSQCVS